MQWALAALIFFIVAGWMGVRGLREKRHDEQVYLQQMKSSTEKYQALLLRDAMPNLSPADLNYRPVANEQIYAAIRGVADNRNGTAGRLIVTNKAIVFETSARSDRFPLTSLSALDIALDGFRLRKRSGPVREFRSGQNADLLGLIRVISWGLN